MPSDLDPPGGDPAAPICPACGVTALPGAALGLPVDFACDNADCPAFGERVT